MVIGFFHTFLSYPSTGRDSVAELFCSPPPLVYSSSTGFVHIFTLAVSGLFCFVTVHPLNLTSVCPWNGATHEWTLTEKRPVKELQGCDTLRPFDRDKTFVHCISSIKHLFQSGRNARAVVCLSCQSAQSYQVSMPCCVQWISLDPYDKPNCVVELRSVYWWNASLFILLTKENNNFVLFCTVTLLSMGVSDSLSTILQAGSGSCHVYWLITQ